MVTDEKIIKEINVVREKITSGKLSKHFKNWNRTMQYYFPDIDAYFYIIVEKGIPGEVIKGRVEKPEISYEMTTGDFFALNRGEISGLKLYNQKRIKIKASMPDILKLQKLE